MIALTLDDLAHIVGGELHLFGDAKHDDLVSGPVDTDSREIVTGGIFVAKPGEHTDGHRFVETARTRGAVLAIVEHQVDAPITQIVVADAVASLADLAEEVVARVRARGSLQVVGITGSNGKTTTKNFLARILEGEGETVAPVRSFNNEVGAPLTMLRVTERTRYLVSEFGASAPGAIAELAELVSPDIAVVLMIGLAHAEGFGGLDETTKAKEELVTASAKDATVVLNRDDPRVWGMSDAARAAGKKVVSFGQTPAADVSARDVGVSAEGTQATVRVAGRDYSLALQILGAHHVSNALASIAAAIALGVTVEAAIARVEAVDIAERWRMQPLGNDDVRIINDAYNASPDSTAAALRTLVQIARPEQRTIAVLGAMSELGDVAGAEHDRIGLLAVRLNIARIIVVGADARRLYLSAVGEGSWNGEAVYLTDPDAAFAYLQEELRSGDLVLVKSSNSVGLRFLGDRLGGLFL